MLLAASNLLVSRQVSENNAGLSVNKEDKMEPFLNDLYENQIFRSITFEHQSLKAVIFTECTFMSISRLPVQKV